MIIIPIIILIILILFVIMILKGKKEYQVALNNPEHPYRIFKRKGLLHNIFCILFFSLLFPWSALVLVLFFGWDKSKSFAFAEVYTIWRALYLWLFLIAVLLILSGLIQSIFVM